MGVQQKAERAVFRLAMRAPARVQRRLAGRPVVIDGQRLAPEVQLMFRLERLTRMPAVGGLPLAHGRRMVERQSALTGGEQPIGSTRDLTVADRPARLYTPAGPPTSSLLLFFHGGGFVYGSLASHDALCRVLAERAGTRVLAVDYRLAPEHPFPAPFDDAVAAYRWVLSSADSLGVDPARIAVGGDSAGATLSICVARTAATESLPLAFQSLIYPATVGHRDTRSLRLFGTGFYLDHAFIDMAERSLFTDDAQRDDPRMSPLTAPVPAGLAPAHVVTAGYDPLRDEGEAYARHLADADVAVELRRFPELFHGFANLTDAGPVARAAIEEIADALRTGLAAVRN